MKTRSVIACVIATLVTVGWLNGCSSGEASPTTTATTTTTTISVVEDVMIASFVDTLNDETIEYFCDALWAGGDPQDQAEAFEREVELIVVETDLGRTFAEDVMREIDKNHCG